MSSRPARVRAPVALLVALALTLLALAPGASAQSREDGAPPASLGLSDAVRASTWGPAALYFNPAGLSRVHRVIVEARYGYLDGRDGNTVGAAIVDGHTNQIVAMGVSYDYISSAVDGVDRDGHSFRAGISTQYLSGDFAIFAGVGARYLDLTVGTSKDAFPDTDAWTIDAGLMFDIAQRIRLGVVGQNLLETDSDEARRKLGLGLTLTFAALELSGDLEIDLADRVDGAVLGYAFGAQYAVQGVFFLRAGVLIDRVRDQERISGGFGYGTSEYAIDIGYSSAVSDPEEMQFGIGFKYSPTVADY